MKAIIAVVLLVFIIAFANASRYSTRVVQEDAAAVKAYWTEENMRNAIEKELILSGGPIEPLADPIEFSSIDGAEPVATEAVEPEFPEEDPEYASQHDKRYPFPFSEGYAPSYNIYPYSAVGKVFFTSGGLNYVCSAAVIAQNTISTAGHCVYDAANGWVTNFIFVPGFNNGAQPFGQWASFQIFSNSDWTGAASFCRDYATVVLRRNGGVSVGTRTGWFGTLRNAGYAQTWRTLGYPQAAPFDGNWNYFADSYFGVQDTRCGGKCNVGGSCSPGTIGIGSRATGGASGGPWVIGFGGANQVNSVNSYKYTTAQPNAIYGPYFDDTWFNTVYSPAVAISPP